MLIRRGSQCGLESLFYPAAAAYSTHLVVIGGYGNGVMDDSDYFLLNLFYSFNCVDTERAGSAENSLFILVCAADIIVVRSCSFKTS